MTRSGFVQLQDVLLDDDFPELDLALRRGRHIDRDDAALYSLLSDAQELLETFYRRFGCELVHKPDGYFYLLPTGDKLSRRQLAPGDMLVGQALALAYLDPAAAARGGAISSEELIAQLSAVLGSDALIAAFNPKRKRFDERVAHKNVRNRVSEAVRRLASLGFVELCEGENLRLRPALMRFAEPVRGLSEPAEALAKLVAQGEVALAPEADVDDEGDEELSGEDEDEAAEPANEAEVAAAVREDEGEDHRPEPVFDAVLSQPELDYDMLDDDGPAPPLDDLAARPTLDSEMPEPALDDEASDAFEAVDVRVSDHPAALLDALDQAGDEESA